MIQYSKSTQIYLNNLTESDRNKFNKFKKFIKSTFRNVSISEIDVFRMFNLPTYMHTVLCQIQKAWVDSGLYDNERSHNLEIVYGCYEFDVSYVNTDIGYRIVLPRITSIEHSLPLVNRVLSSDNIINNIDEYMIENRKIYNHRHYRRYVNAKSKTMLSNMLKFHDNYNLLDFNSETVFLNHTIFDKLKTLSKMNNNNTTVKNLTKNGIRYSIYSHGELKIKSPYHDISISSIGPNCENNTISIITAAGMTNKILETLDIIILKNL